MNNQRFVADQRGMPVEDVGGSSARLSVSGETVAFFYSNSGTRTADAGQAAGTLVEAVLAYGPIANSSGDQVGNPMNTSLSFTSTAFTSEIRLNYKDLEELDALSFANRLTKIQSLVGALKTAQANGVTTAMANGDYVVDYRKGILWGLKASTQASLTSAAYKTLQKNSAVVPGTSAISLGKAEDAAHASGDTGVMLLSKRTDTAATSAGTDGDYATINTDGNGATWVRELQRALAENNTDSVIHTAFRAITSSTGTVSTDISAALEASSVTKASSGRLYGMVGYVDGTLASGTYYILFMNASSLPADGAVTLLVSAVPVVHTTGTPTLVNVDFSNIGGIYASTGIVACISTTALTKTIGGAYLNTVIFYA